MIRTNGWATFLDCPDILYITPGRKDVVYLGRTGREKMFESKRYNLKDLHKIANGNPYLIQVSESMYFQDEFSERLQFNQLYNFIKKNKMYVFNKNIPHNSCLCETCENATLLG